MNSNTIIENYIKINEYNSRQIILIYEQENFMIGKRNGKVCFIIRSNGGKQNKFRNGDMSVDLNKEYIVSNETGLYSIIFYESNNIDKIRIFIETLMNIVSNKSINSEQLLETYNNISEVFKPFKFYFSDFIGYFGELIFIYLMYKEQEINLVEYYQANKQHLVDFKFNEINFEIKTSLTNKREHTINNEQLNGNGYLCSILLKEDNQGKDFSELFNECKPLFRNNKLKYAFFENYILSIPFNVLKERYLLSTSILKFYNFKDIPRFEDYPDSISKIKYTINLSNIVSRNINDINFDH